MSRRIIVRGGKEMTVWHCTECSFDFFAHDPTESLAADKLDKTRLAAAGLDIPTVERDFANGIEQSGPLVKKYLDASDNNRNVLEIGCSWGYFLQLVKDAGPVPYGVEVNHVRCNYVTEHLGIPCKFGIEELESSKVRFKKIFLFYVLEYVPNPVQYIQRLVNLLEPDGEIIFITPNITDPLKDLWRNEAFEKFFYDEHAINYMSPLSLRRAIERLEAGESSVATRQGYSIVNHVSWFLTNGPRTTGVVGGDNFIRDIVSRLKETERADSGESRGLLGPPAGKLAEMIANFDSSYKEYLESRELGNQIHVVIRK